MATAVRMAPLRFTASKLHPRPLRTDSGLSARLWRHPIPAIRAAAVDLDESLEIGEDFYSLLGVSPRASERDIKRAYYSLMRTCHPDQARDEESTNFCALLNDIYETLSDPIKRAVYNEIAGFSEDSINPFLDDTMPKDQVFVDEFTCIGCRNCCNVCPKTFEIEEDFGRARAVRQNVDTEAKLQEAIDTCPVNCISWVSMPQLSLLDSAMARMGRISVVALMTGGGGTDVFTEASLAWEKRQAAIRRKRETVAFTTNFGGGGFWSNMVSWEGSTGSRVYEESGKRRRSAADAETTTGGDKDTRSIAKLAARAARAARTWKSYQDFVQTRRSPLQLTSADD